MAGGAAARAPVDMVPVADGVLVADVVPAAGMLPVADMAARPMVAAAADAVITDPHLTGWVQNHR
jgi:hypothetical protein